MKHQRILMGLLVLVMGCQSSPSNPPDQLTKPVEDLLSLMNERLALMPDVAKHKASLNLPVDDPKREESILQAVEVDAKATGITKEFARSFFQAQFDAAKQVQAEIGKSALQPKVTDDSMKLAGEELTAIRTKINDLNMKLLTALGKIDWATRGDDARKLFAELGPKRLANFSEDVRKKALRPVTPE